MKRRTTITLAGAEHRAPIPSAAIVGGLLVSSAINGRDHATGEYPDDPAAQVHNAFSNMVSLVKIAGGGIEDIVRVTVFLRDRADRALVDEEWLRIFPDADDRPARHALPLDRPGRAHVQLEIMAVIAPEVSGV